MSSYRWVKKEIIEQYINSLFNSKKQNNNLNRENLSKMLFSIIMKMPEIRFSNLKIKKDLEYDEFLVSDRLTHFEQKNIKLLINKCLNIEPKWILCENNTKNKFNHIYESLIFLREANYNCFNELYESVTTNKIYIDDEKKSFDFNAIHYHVDAGNYYYINRKNESQTFMNINHEIFHGSISNLTKHKYDDINRDC